MKLCPGLIKPRKTSTWWKGYKIKYWVTFKFKQTTTNIYKVVLGIISDLFILKDICSSFDLYLYTKYPGLKITILTILKNVHIILLIALCQTSCELLIKTFHQNL